MWCDEPPSRESLNHVTAFVTRRTRACRREPTTAAVAPRMAGGCGDGFGARRGSGLPLHHRGVLRTAGIRVRVDAVPALDGSDNQPGGLRIGGAVRRHAPRTILHASGCSHSVDAGLRGCRAGGVHHPGVAPMDLVGRARWHRHRRHGPGLWRGRGQPLVRAQAWACHGNLLRRERLRPADFPADHRPPDRPPWLARCFTLGGGIRPGHRAVVVLALCQLPRGGKNHRLRRR